MPFQDPRKASLTWHKSSRIPERLLQAQLWRCRPGKQLCPPPPSAGEAQRALGGARHPGPQSSAGLAHRSSDAKVELVTLPDRPRRQHPWDFECQGHLRDWQIPQAGSLGRCPWSWVVTGEAGSRGEGRSPALGSKADSSPSGRAHPPPLMQAPVPRPTIL